MVVRLKPLAFAAPTKTQEQSGAIPALFYWSPHLTVVTAMAKITAGGDIPISAAHTVYPPFERRSEKRHKMCGASSFLPVPSLRQQLNCFSPGVFDADDYRATLGPVFPLFWGILRKTLL